MAKSWRKRLRRGRLASWLGRIEGVERPALLVGIGLLLYRVWRNEESRVRPQEPAGAARSIACDAASAVDRRRRTATNGVGLGHAVVAGPPS